MDQNHLDTHEVLDSMEAALAGRHPFSLVRVGHAEMFVLMDALWSEDISDFDRYRRYCGITSLKAGVAEDIIGALRAADIVGTGHHTDLWRQRMARIFQHCRLTPRKTCSAWVTHYMVQKPRFYRMIEGLRVVLLGRRSEEAVDRILQSGAVEAKAMRIEGLKDIDRVCRYLAYYDQFDLALLAAGVPATIAAPRLAELTGRVAVDFGHGLDLIIDGPELIDCQQYFEELVSEYNDRNRRQL